VQTLRKCFGLEAHFVTVKKGKNAKIRWVKDGNHVWHEKKGLQTTVCFLKPMDHFTPNAQTSAEPKKSSKGKGKQKPAIEAFNEDYEEAVMRRFQRALNMLHLRPFFHPSQAGALMSYVASWKAAMSSEGPGTPKLHLCMYCQCDCARGRES